MRKFHLAARWFVVAATIARCIALAVPEATAQTPRWVQLPPPSAPGLHVRDSKRDRELFFDESGILAFPDAAVTSWQRISLGSNPVSAANDFAFYDPARDRVWAISKSLSNASTIWFMDLGATTLQWTSQPYTFANPALADTLIQYRALAFDPVRDRVIAFGGYVTCSSCGGGGTNGVYSLSLGGTPQWSDEPVDGLAPGGRLYSAMVYDPFRDRMLVYGGGTPYSDQTWALSLGTPMSWSFLTPTQLPPQGREYPATALDSLGGRWFVVGGAVSGGDAGGETWSLDLSTSSPADKAVWTQDAPGNGDPSPPTGRALFIQPGQSRVVSFNGTSMWTLSLGSTPAWNPVGGDTLGPVQRLDLVTFVDVDSQRVYAGLGAGSSLQVRPLGQEVPWTTLPAQGPDSPRYGAVAVTDPAARRALVFGGAMAYDPGATGFENAELWSFDLDGGGWTNLAPANPPFQRTEALGVFDTAHRRLIIHGGRYTNPTATPLSDTWIYDAVNGTWSSPAVGDYGAWWGEVGIYDPVRDRVVTFGGASAVSGGGILQLVHVLPLGSSVGTWAGLATAGTPPDWANWLINNSVDVLAAAYDPIGDRMIVMAGQGPATAMWALSLGGSPTWTQLTPAGALPLHRRGASLVSDPARNRLLLVGGQPTDVQTDFDTWALYFDQTSPTQLSFYDSDVTSHQVTLRWYTNEAVAATVYRRAPGENWGVLGHQGPDGSGIITWVDGDVVPGQGYDYRLGIGEAQGETYYGETHVVVPSGSTLSLAGMRPNPSRGELLASFTLPTAAPATLELLDVAGRRLIARDVGALGAGTHSLRLDVKRLPAGLYFLRLQQAGHSFREKVALVR